MKKHIAATALLLALSACSSLDFWGDDAQEVSPETESKRIAVIATEKQLEADTPVPPAIDIPDEEPVNDEWLHSEHAESHGNLSLAPSLTTKKIYSLGNEVEEEEYRITSNPVIAEGKLFVLDGEMELNAYTIDNLKKDIWDTRLLKEHGDVDLIGGGIAYQSGVLYVTVGYNRVYAVNASDGTIKWDVQVPGLVRAAPEVYGSRVIVQTIDSRTYALSTFSGRVVWNHIGPSEQATLLGTASPVADNGVVIVSYSSGDIFALRVTDGKELWSDNLVRNRVSGYQPSDVDASPVIADDVVYAISNSGVLAANSLQSGMRLWEREVAGVSSPWIAGDMLYLVDHDYRLVAVDARDGRIYWVVPLDREFDEEPIVWTGPVMADGKLWVVGSHGKLLVFSPEDGKQLDGRTIDDRIFAWPVVANNGMYLFSSDGDLTVLKGE